LQELAGQNAPSVENSTYLTYVDTPIRVTLTGRPAAEGDVLRSFEIVEQPQHGMLHHAGNPINNRATYYYNPHLGWEGNDRFTYRATDNHNQNSNTGTIVITVGIQCTCVLTPANAIELVWSYTGKFSADETSRKVAEVLPEKDWIRLQKHAEAGAAEINEIQKRYISKAMLLMERCMRNLDIIYKGRELKFGENKKLREAYLDIVNKNSNFGLNMSDIVKALPGLTIGPAGSIPFLALFPAATGSPAPIQWWIIPAVLSAVGYILTIVFARFTNRRILKQYVRMAYERNQYYFHYLDDATEILKILYLDLDNLHETIFGFRHPIGNMNFEDYVKKITQRAKITFCPYINNHFRFNIITPSLWPRCEAGNWETCPYWLKRYTDYGGFGLKKPFHSDTPQQVQQPGYQVPEI
jgi:Bacterial Ig domain